MDQFTKQYEEMRPYNKDEVKAAMKRILAFKDFEKVLEYVFPNRSLEESIHVMSQVDSTDSFQKEFSSNAVEEVLNKTADQFTYSGLEYLDKNTSYLFISNHRDIVLDSAILQNVLFKNGYRTTQITFGSNLMKDQFIVDIGKVNKMFTLYRGGARQEIYENARLHSRYINKVLIEENESIWIAQRDGRTKNGDDQTQPSLIKMLTMASEKPYDYIKDLKALNIIPVSISYEYEPCDIYKVRERLLTTNGVYEKKEGEDLHSILHGIVSPKGNVHLSFCTPVNNFIDENIEQLHNGNIHKEVACFMDKQIHKNFKINPINTFAHNLLSNNGNWNDLKSETDSDCINFINAKCEGIENPEIFREELLKMYAAPAENHKKACNGA